MRRVIAWLPFIVGCAAIFSVSNLERPPVPDALSFQYSDKVLHAFAYGGLGAFAAAGTTALFLVVSRRRAMVAFVLSSVYGATDEVHQAFVPGRSATLADWVADTVGAAVIVGLLLLWFTHRQRSADRN